MLWMDNVIEGSIKKKYKEQEPHGTKKFPFFSFSFNVMQGE